MTIGSWYVLGRRDNLTPVTSFEAQLEGIRYGRLVEIETDYAEIEIDDRLTGNKATNRIFVDDEAEVAVESRRLADLFPERPERHEIAATDVRYTITWDCKYSDENYNARCVIAETLAKVTGGIVYDLMDGRIVWSSFE